MKPDVLLTWPTGVDYPLCRLQLKLFRKYFNDICVCLYEHGTPNFGLFLMENHPNYKFSYSTETGDSWRESSVLRNLEKSKSDWVLFTEQDFFWKDGHFLETVFKATDTNDIVGTMRNDWLCPWFILTRRELIEKTSKDFSVQGQNKDHFYKFGQELLSLGKFVDLNDLGLFSGRDWMHFSSLTWNLFRIKDQKIADFHEPENFLIYNYLSRTNRVSQDPRWLAFTYFAETLLSSYGRFLNQLTPDESLL